MAELRVSLSAVRQNTAAVAGLLGHSGLDLVGVTKGCLGNAEVARAMVDGGVVALADTHDDHLRSLRSGCPTIELHRIHLPPISGPFEAGDVTYISSTAGADAVASLAGSARRRVMIQLETGDLREGVPRGGLFALAQYVVEHLGLELAGLSTNYACFQGAPGDIRQSVDAVAAAARELRSAGLSCERVSGGNSSLVHLLVKGERLPAEVTELRCGEALLLGQDALLYEPIPGCRQDGCVVRADVLEDCVKSTPRGQRRRLVLGIGRHDLATGSVHLLSPGLIEIGRSSDYLVAEVDGPGAGVAAGDSLEMIPSYTALVAAWASPMVQVTVSERG